MQPGAHVSDTPGGSHTAITVPASWVKPHRRLACAAAGESTKPGTPRPFLPQKTAGVRRLMTEAEKRSAAANVKHAANVTGINRKSKGTSDGLNAASLAKLQKTAKETFAAMKAMLVDHVEAKGILEVGRNPYEA